MRRHWCVALVMSLAATALSAQGVPLVSAEVTGGDGAHTLHTPGIYFQSQNARLWRAAATVRLGSSGKLRPILSVERSNGCGLGWGCGERADCPLDPDGHCEQWFVDPLGYAIGGGVAAAPNRYLAASISTGPGFFQQRSWYFSGTVSLRVVPHVALVSDARYILSTDGRGGRTWFSPISFGLKGY